MTTYSLFTKYSAARVRAEDHESKNCRPSSVVSLSDRGYSKIVLDTNLKNTRAQHVYEKLGFRKLGVRANSWVDQLGQPQSAVDYALTEADFISFL